MSTKNTAHQLTSFMAFLTVICFASLAEADDITKKNIVLPSFNALGKNPLDVKTLSTNQAADAKLLHPGIAQTFINDGVIVGMDLHYYDDVSFEDLIELLGPGKEQWRRDFGLPDMATWRNEDARVAFGIYHDSDKLNGPLIMVRWLGPQGEFAAPRQCNDSED